MKDKTAIAEKKQKLINMTAGFCNEYLNKEYKQLCEKLIQKMSRKRHVPFLYGRIDIWAAGIVHTIGSINFLFDRSFEPYNTADDICNYFGTKKSTTSQKSKVIRDMFKLWYYDDEFSTNHIRENNPFAKRVMIDGLIVKK